jgi:drug/metabolite transporter (DMT)-like permease
LAGLKTANAASVSIWLNMELVVTAVLGVLIFKDALDRNAWIGVFLTIAAGIVTSFVEGTSGIVSELLIAAACFCWGIDNHLTALTDGASPQSDFVFYSSGLGSIIILSFYSRAISMGPPHFHCASCTCRYRNQSAIS